MGAFLLRGCRNINLGVSWSNSNFIGFYDDFWKELNGKVHYGICGCLVDMVGNMFFISSGPCATHNPLGVEKKALLFLFHRIISNSSISGFYTMYTNSKILEECYIKRRACLVNNFRQCSLAHVELSWAIHVVSSSKHTTWKLLEQ